MNLSPREEQVIRLVAEGLSSTEIAERLGISDKTAETHRARAYAKLGLNRKTLVPYAVREGWFKGALTTLLLMASPLVGQRPYWPVSVESLATGRVYHSHVETRGRVAYVGHESDQDMHVRLRGLMDTLAYVVAECIPKMPCLTSDGLPWVPKIGDTPTVFGILRRDSEHGWVEVHPVEGVRP